MASMMRQFGLKAAVFLGRNAVARMMTVSPGGRLFFVQHGRPLVFSSSKAWGVVDQGPSA